MRCEGWTRHGGVFSFGPVTWEQCEAEAKLMVKFKQEGEVQTLPACAQCYVKIVESDKIEVLDVKDIPKKKVTRRN